MKKTKKIYITALCVVSVSLTVGCSDINKKLHLTENKSTINSVELLNIIESKDFNKYQNSVMDFNLGNVSLGEGKEVIDIDLKGTIGVPKSLKNAPIIFIISGNNNSSSTESSQESDAYQGLNYLVDALSKYGFLTVSISTDMSVEKEKKTFVVEDKMLNLVFEEHLKYLTDAINGKRNKYPISLYKKGDINNIGLIGQSNTGRTIYNIANQQVSNSSLSIKGLLSITPNEGIPVSSFPDIPTSILSTEHSLNTNISFDMYAEMEKDIKRESITQLTYLIGGDADKFNDLVKEDTLTKKDSRNTLSRASLATNEDTITDSIKHEEFLSSYAVDFFEFIFGDGIENSIYSSNSPTAQKLYQKDILTKLHVKDTKEVFNNKSFSESKFNLIKTKEVTESSIPSIDSAIDFNEPATNIELKLVQLDWKNSNASLSIPIASGNTNLSDYSSISIEWAINHSSELNVEDIDKVSLSLIDDSGDKSEVVLLDETSLNKISGESIVQDIGGKSISNWSRFTPISETRIPLSFFKDIDMENIKDVEINFNDNASGSIFIKNIHFKK